MAVLVMLAGIGSPLGANLPETSCQVPGDVRRRRPSNTAENVRSRDEQIAVPPCDIFSSVSASSADQSHYTSDILVRRYDLVTSSLLRSRTFRDDPDFNGYGR